MQHTDTQYLGTLEEELLTAVLRAAPVEKRLEGLSAEDVLHGIPVEKRLEGLTPEDLAAGLTPEQATRLRELLERKLEE